MNNQILVTGANGQLGSELKMILGKTLGKVFYTDVYDLDITDINALYAFTSQNNITIIINCAAYTNVDKAEEEPEMADRVNHLAVNNLAEISAEQNIRLIHISTDYVFSGNSFLPYSETDNTNPTGIYGKTKLEGEKAIISKNIQYTIIRTSWLYSSFGNNFVKTILRLANERNSLKVIYDQIGSPTYAADLARVIATIINTNQWRKGIYHFSNEGAVSWYDFSQAIIELSNINTKIVPCRTEEYPTKAKRPIYSVMDKAKIKQKLGIEIPYWKKSLSECISVIQKNKHNCFLI